MRQIQKDYKISDYQDIGMNLISRYTDRQKAYIPTFGTYENVHPRSETPLATRQV